MKYQFAPEGLTQQDILQRIANGWAVITGVRVTGPQVVVPGQPPSMQGRVDVWFLPEPMMPQGMVIATLVAASREGCDVVTLNELAMHLFGRPLKDLDLAMQRAAQPVIQGAIAGDDQCLAS